ncbi:PH domain-containing protein [Planctomicrobium sp. SH668]|uniref:PH domain-containing protein n=1 Tax=Planctomicrobium sp. SH668 TaxID=3448126 RepID=UPI003F5B49CF
MICWIDRSRTTLTVINKRTVLQHAFLSVSTSEVMNHDVRDFQVAQSLSQRLIRSGRNRISSSGQSGFEIELNGIKDPMHVRNLIDKCRR